MNSLCSPFGVMFHHFHDRTTYIPCQGSLSAEMLLALIEALEKRYYVTDAQEYFRRSINNCLEKDMVCLTFDDGLRCQYDVALPVLKKKNLTAFWFIYTSPFCGEPDRLELYHNFRFSCFETIETFYTAFFDFLKNYEFAQKDLVQREIAQFSIDKYRPDCTFYTYNDRLFRYLRTFMLGETYFNIMDSMMQKWNYDIDEAKKKLWIDERILGELDKNGHIIGLHSHSHHTNLATRSKQEQLKEYKKNKEQIEQILGHSCQTVSYPCGAYNHDTFLVMEELGIKVGFADKKVKNPCLLTMSRLDNAYLMDKKRQ